MYITVVILIVLASLLMCLIVLVQESKGGGLASSFSENNAMLGVRKTTDVVEKITWALAIAMIVLSILSVAFLGNDAQTGKSVISTTTEEVANPGIETNTPAPVEAPAEVPAEAPAQN